MKKCLKFFTPIIIYSFVSEIAFLLFWCVRPMIADFSSFAAFVIAINLCSAGSFLCGCSARSSAGVMGMFVTIMIVVLSVPLWVAALMAENTAFIYALSGSSYFLVFAFSGFDISFLNSFSFLIPVHLMNFIPIILSLALPVGFIVFGYKFRAKHGRIA